ncbi:ABC transporter substrate-binding protein [Paraburkholderia fungorum]
MTSETVPEPVFLIHETTRDAIGVAIAVTGDVYVSHSYMALSSALVSADYVGGWAGVKRFKELLLELSSNVEIVVEDYPKFGATDYTATINNVLAAKPDYVFFILFDADLLTFSKQANSVDFFKQVNNRFIALYDFNAQKALAANRNPYDCVRVERSAVSIHPVIKHRAATVFFSDRLPLAFGRVGHSAPWPLSTNSWHVLRVACGNVFSRAVQL